jgi:serine/threonine-protein kinase
MVMVYVPAGQFEMGYSEVQVEEILRVYNDGQREWYEVDQPAHTVDLGSFWIDQTEVTNAQFCKFLNKRGNLRQEGISWLEPGAGHGGIVYGLIEESDGVFTPKAGYEDYPVIEVSWYGAAAYCAWVNGRLPTEAEWEYAARGPDGLLYPWGNTFDGNLVNYRDASFTFTSRGFEKDTVYNDGHASWAPVGSYPDGASWCGALDMAGNVWEWVNDWFDRDYYARSPVENPQGPLSGTIRIGRGGSWYDPRWRVCSGERKGLSPSSYRMHWIGFRCVVPIRP